jgi:integrating conjugative element protein (TIGR03755 family)
MKKLLIISMLLFSQILHAESESSEVNTLLPVFDEILDYKIGRNEMWRYRYKKPAVAITSPGLNWNVGASCSGWDAGISIDGLMNDLDSQFNRLEKDMYNAVKGYVASLPSLILQRLDPALYETISSGMIKAEDIFEVKAKTCREMSERFSNGNDYGEMADTSFWMDFSKEASEGDNGGSNDKDLVKTIDDAEKNKGDGGVVGADGEMCGGLNQEMCKTVEVVTAKGYEAMTGGQIKTEDSFELTDPWIWRIWEDSESAYDWIKDVVGNVEFAVCDECTKLIETPGIGVYQDIAYETDSLIQKFNALINNGKVPTNEELREVSTNDFFISEGVVFALREESANSTMQLFVSRISEDVALMRIVDKLLAARRILLIGVSDAKVVATEMNIKIMDKKIQMINDEITIIKQELELKKAARGDTIVTLLNRSNSRRSISVNDSYNKSVIKRMGEGAKKFGGRS